MSFGFSVGDFLAAGKLIHQIIGSLQDIGGAKSGYQELIRELRSLDKALRHLDRLQSDSSTQDRSIQSIKFAALSCRQPLEQFLAKIQKFDSSLGVRAKGQTPKTIFRKVHWGVGMQSEVTKLQGYLNLHVATINILLMEHSLEKMDLAGKRADSDNLQVREKLDAAQGVIEQIGNSIRGQLALIQQTHTAVRNLMSMICGEFRTSWRSMGQMVAQLCVSMQQIYGVVLEIRGSMTPVDTRFTFFQTPLICEDALGFKFPIPSEWDFGMVKNHIQYRFRQGTGSQDVKAGNWELFKTKNSQEVISPSTRLLPGLEITMAIIVTDYRFSDGICPILSCFSQETTLSPTGSRICCACGTKFSRATKNRAELAALAYLVESSYISRNNAIANSSPPRECTKNSSIQWHEQNELKNVRCGEEADPWLRVTIDGEVIGRKVYWSDVLDWTPDLNAYLDRVNARFEADPASCDRFLNTMKQLRNGESDSATPTSMISELYRGESALMNAFSDFLSPGNELKLYEDAYQVQTMDPYEEMDVEMEG